MIKLILELPVIVVLSCLVISSFGEDPSAQNSKIFSIAGKSVKEILEIIEQNPNQPLIEILPQSAKDPAIPEYQFGIGAKKRLGQKSKSIKNPSLAWPKAKERASRSLKGTNLKEATKHIKICEGLCNNGVPPLFPELEVKDVDFDGRVETCGDLDEVAKTLPADSKVCMFHRFDLQADCCVMSRPEPCEGLCNSGSSILQADKLAGDIDGDGIPETCADIDERTKAHPINGSFCNFERYIYQPICCDMTPQRCEGLCSNGDPPLYPDLELDVDGDGKFETCSDLNKLVKTLSADNSICLFDRFKIQSKCCTNMQEAIY